LMKAYPAGIVSTGLRDILIPVNTLGQLLSIRPDFDRVRQTSEKYGVVGYHVFTLETKYGSTAHCRNFAPAYGIPEEAATGTSNGALGCYLFHHGLISEDEAEHLVFEQGYSMGRPSEILACLAISGKEIVEVRVGGIALGLKKAEIEL
jgi:PhzF family phenazine biosynthesis protein